MSFPKPIRHSPSPLPLNPFLLPTKEVKKKDAPPKFSLSNYYTRWFAPREEIGNVKEKKTNKMF
jgi:hypothetical protein